MVPLKFPTICTGTMFHNTAYYIYALILIQVYMTFEVFYNENNFFLVTTVLSSLKIIHENNTKINPVKIVQVISTKS